MRAWLGLLLSLVVVVGVFTAGPPRAQAAAVATPGAFVSLPPSRLLDTRITGPKVGWGQTRTLTVTGVGGVPDAGVSAVVLNVTVTDTTAAGFLTVSPTGMPRPTASNLNWSAGVTIPNAVIVKVGPGGQIDLFQSGPGSANVIVDVAGYFVSGPVTEPGGFTSLPPARILDSRISGGKFASSETRDLQILGCGGVPATGVSAVVMNMTVTDTNAAGYLTVFPSGTARPVASNLNWAPGWTIPNLVTVRVGDNGKVSLFQFGAGSANVIADVAGYYLAGTPSEPGMFVSLSPARVLDTRSTSPIAGLTDLPLPVLGKGGVPATRVAAVVINTTVTETTMAGYLTAFPGATTAPTASNLNWSGPDTTIPNLVTVKVGTDGRIKFHNGSPGPVQVVADTAGYYLSVPPAAPTISGVSPASGYVTGGTVVTITGTNLGGVSLVTVGGVDGTILTPVSDTEATVSVPAHAAGAADVKVTTPGGIATSVSAYTYRPLGTTSVVAWGGNDAGQTSAPAGLSGVVAISAGGAHSLALQADGTVQAWGDNTAGQASVPVGLGAVLAISAGDAHSVALKSDGTVVAWGDNSAGQSSVPAGLSGVRAISAGGRYTLALQNDGTVVAWGDNTWGQSAVPAGLSGVVAISAGWVDSVALKSDGTVVAWGDNVAGQTTVPAGLTGVVAIAAGDYHSVALKNDGTVVAWGETRGGVTTVPAGLTGVVAISASGNHTLGLKTDGTVVAWGSGYDGETTVPTGLSGVVAISAGYVHNLALKTL